jgi:hypothetical protein
LQPIFQSELLDSDHDKLPALFGPPIFNTDEIFGDVLARKIFKDVFISDKTSSADLCKYVAAHQNIIHLPNNGSDVVDSVTLNVAHNCTAECAITEGCDTIAVRIKVNVTKCEPLYRGVLSKNEMGTLKNSMLTKYVFDQNLEKLSLDKLRSVEKDPDDLDLAKIFGKKLIGKEVDGIHVSASCDFYNSNHITVISGGKTICMLNPGLCDMKVGQIIRMKTFRDFLNFERLAETSSRVSSSVSSAFWFK